MLGSGLLFEMVGPCRLTPARYNPSNVSTMSTSSGEIQSRSTARCSLRRIPESPAGESAASCASAISRTAPKLADSPLSRSAALLLVPYLLWIALIGATTVGVMLLNAAA